MTEHINKPPAVLKLALGAKIYRACCLEELQLEPGRVACAEVVALNVDRDRVGIARIWQDGTKTKPAKTWGTALVMQGWRNTEEDAIAAGIVYLKRQVDDHQKYLADAETALAALTSRQIAKAMS